MVQNIPRQKFSIKLNNKKNSKYGTEPQSSWNNMIEVEEKDVNH